MGLIYVQGDAMVDRIKRHGRFTLPLAQAQSPIHFRAALTHYMQKMVAGFEQKDGYRLVRDDFEWRGPLPHLEFADSAEVDEGPLAAPDPRDIEASMRWGRAERARQAREVGDGSGDLVDFQIICVFERRVPGVSQLLQHSLGGQRR